MTYIKHFFDLEFTVVAVPHEFYVEYKIYEIVATEHGSVNPDGSEIPLWQMKDTDVRPVPVDKLEEAEVFLEGSVKWDGCSNWKLSALQQGIALHACDRKGLVRVGEIMARCWDWTEGICPKWRY